MTRKLNKIINNKIIKTLLYLLVFVKLLADVHRETSSRWARAPAVSSRFVSEESSRADTSMPRAAENPDTTRSNLKEDGERMGDIPVDKKC